MAGACHVQCSVPAIVTPMPLKTKTKTKSVEPREAGRNGGGYNLGFVEFKPTKTVGREREEYAADLHVGTTGVKLANPPCRLAFVYGTLKQGFSNHWLIEDAVSKGHARFIGVAKTKQRYPLVCGPFQVPFLLDIPTRGLHVKGEVYAVDSTAVELLDELEGVLKGHYVRRPLSLTCLQSLSVQSSVDDIEAEAYFAAGPLTQGLASAPHIEAYTKKETVNYIRRKDRPQNRTFLEHVHHWIDVQESATVRV